MFYAHLDSNVSQSVIHFADSSLICTGEGGGGSRLRHNRRLQRAATTTKADDGREVTERMQGLSLFRVLQSKKANKAYALNQRPRTILGKAEVPSAFGRMVGTLALVVFVSTHLLKGKVDLFFASKIYFEQRKLFRLDRAGSSLESA